MDGMPSTPPGIVPGAADGAAVAAGPDGAADATGASLDGAAATPGSGCASGIAAGASVRPPGVTVTVASRTSSGVPMSSFGYADRRADTVALGSSPSIVVPSPSTMI
jgi:hypothetical protein